MYVILFLIYWIYEYVKLNELFPLVFDIFIIDDIFEYL